MKVNMMENLRSDRGVVINMQNTTILNPLFYRAFTLVTL